jgi:hypothetical protein
MKPSQTNDNQDNLFQSRLSNQINPRHEMVILSKMINWNGLEMEFSSFHIDNGKGGQPPKPVRQFAWWLDCCFYNIFILYQMNRW